MAAVAFRRTAGSLSLLFARYVRGEIADPAWSRLMHLLDDGEVTGTERLALTRFVGEVIAEGGPAALHVPREDEARDLLGDVRPANPIRRGQ